MNYVKKMILVDPKRLSTAASEPTIETDPHLQVLRQLHREMQDVLNNTDTNDLDKVTAYNQILQRYLEYQEKYKRPKPVPVSLSHQSEYATASTGVMTVLDELLRVVPKNTRKQAEALLLRIKDHPDMSWNTRGEFMYRGSAINDSNVVDLIGDLMRSRKSVTRPPQGMDMFLTALKDTNTPRELILNRHRYDGSHRLDDRVIANIYETPRGLKTPQPSTRRLAKGRASPLKQWDTL